MSRRRSRPKRDATNVAKAMRTRIVPSAFRTAGRLCRQERRLAKHVGRKSEMYPGPLHPAIQIVKRLRKHVLTGMLMRATLIAATRRGDHDLI